MPLLGQISVSPGPSSCTMDLTKDPSPLQKSSNSLACDVCDIKFKSLDSLRYHYGDELHKKRSRAMAKCLFGYAPVEPITCLDDMFNYPKRKGAFIGLQYLREGPKDHKRMHFACILCGAKWGNPIFQHILCRKHKKKYITRNFNFLFGNVNDCPMEVIEKIAAIIAEVEGIQMFKNAIKDPNLSSKNAPYEVINKIVEKLQIHGINFIRNYSLRRNLVPVLEAGSHSSGIKEKTTIKNPRVPSESSAASENSSKQKVNDNIEKLQIHGIYSKNPHRKEGTVPCLEIESHSSGINEKNGKRPLRFSPLAGFKRSKSELPHQYTGEPIVSLSRPVPVPFSVSQTTANFPVGDKMHENNSLQATELPTMSYIPSINKDMAPNPIPSLYGLYQMSWPPVEEHFPSWSTAGSFYQNAEYGYGHYSDQNFYYFANASSSGQTSSMSDGAHAYAVETQTSGQETRHPYSQRLHTLGMMGGSDFSHNRPSGQCSSEISLKQDTPSRYGYNLVNGKELSSESSLPSGILSVLNKEPSLPKSPVVIHPEGLPPTSTISCGQTSQSTTSSMPAKTVSVLSPDTLKILQGRDPTSVKSILKRLAEYCPELQQVNISLLVDVLFETGTLS